MFKEKQVEKQQMKLEMLFQKKALLMKLEMLLQKKE